MLGRLYTRIADIGFVILPLVLFGGLVAAYLALVGLRELVPPTQVTFAAGRPDGGYWQIAEGYRRILMRDGIEVVILDTAGSVENAELLADGRADVALIQGGVPVSEVARVEALGAVFLEPLFIFYRTDLTDAADPSQWAALRVAAGEAGSGTRMAVETAAETLQVHLDAGNLLALGNTDAAQALQDGSIDVAVFVAPVTAPYLRPLLTDARIAIAAPRDPEALSRRLAFVRRADIPPAGLDYAARLPPERVELTAMVATLAAQDDLHPALVDRLVRAAIEIHSGPVLISADLRFPMVEGAAFPVNPQARALLEGGTDGPLDRVLPYWIAAQITRVTVLLVPLLVLLVPLIRIMPGIYAWRMRSRVLRRYNELMAIDAETMEALAPDRRATLEARLKAIDAEARSINVPIYYQTMVYTLRLHIDLVRARLTEMDQADHAGRAPAPAPARAQARNA